MDVLVLIDKLDDLIHNAKSVPLTDTVRVEKEEVYDILDQMRASIPEEIKQARWIVKERQDMLAEAKREAERLIQESRDKAEEIASHEEVVRIAHEQSDAILTEAEARAAEMNSGAIDYADEVFGTLEANLDKFLNAVSRSRDKLAQRAMAGSGSQQG
jgi:cell division septum initiation protein DivIVA